MSCLLVGECPARQTASSYFPTSLHIATRASSIILAHNHPSGVPTPSQEDVAMTKNVFLGGAAPGDSAGGPYHYWRGQLCVAQGNVPGSVLVLGRGAEAETFRCHRFCGGTFLIVLMTELLDKLSRSKDQRSFLQELWQESQCKNIQTGMFF